MMDTQSSKRTMVTKEEGRSMPGDEIFPDEYLITIRQDSNSNLNSHEISENERQWLHSLDEISREYFGSLQKPIRSLHKISTEYLGSLQKPKIQMVRKMHREIESNIRCYEPLVVSVGPFHHGKPKRQVIEKYKKLFAIQFANEPEKRGGVLPWLPTNSVSLDELYRKVKDIMPSVRECYAEDAIIAYSDEEFAQMMFLDGCFILQYLHCIMTGNYRELQMKSHDIAFIRRDLFLLENQLPFEVLDVLMSCKFKNNEGMKMIHTFISSAHTKPPQKNGFIRSIKDFLLDFFREGDPLTERYTCTQNAMNLLGCGVESSSFTKEESMKNRLPAHLLELLKLNRINPKAFLEGGGCYLRGDWCSYRSAMELKRAGIHFRPGKSRLLSDVKFSSFHCSALLTLAPITIDDSTKSQFLNLVAYEACPDTPDDFGITSYVSFMDSLIAHAEDVKELRSKGILLNFLRSDQEVADLFNEIAKDLVSHPNAFVDVKDEIEKHYNSKGKLLIGDWTNTHLTSPWTFFAFLAALFVICLQVTDTFLAGVQAYYAAHQNDTKQ